MDSNTGNMLQGVGALLGGAATLLGVLLAIVNQRKIGAAFHLFIAGMLEPRLIEADRRVRATDLQRAEALMRAESAEDRATNWESTADAIERSIEALRIELQEVRSRNDALVDYGQKILEYSVSLEHRAIAAGADLTGLTMPPIPSILADRLNIPETLR